MEGPSHHARPLDNLDPERWPHTVDLNRLAGIIQPRTSLTSRVVAWLETNAQSDGWRLTHHVRDSSTSSALDLRTVFSMHFADADDAFAFKMRWC